MSTPSAWARCWFAGLPRKERQIPTLAHSPHVLPSLQLRTLAVTLQSPISNLRTDEDTDEPTVCLGEGFQTRGLPSASARSQQPAPGERLLSCYHAASQQVRGVDRLTSPSPHPHIPAWDLSVLKSISCAGLLPSFLPLLREKCWVFFWQGHRSN